MAPKKDKRPDWDSYFLGLAHTVKKRSNCLRMAVGVVLVQERHIIATGYNGTPAGIKNCFDGGCERCLERDKENLKEYQDKYLCICIHAEQNSILQSAYHGVSTRGAVMYSTISPCLQCVKSIINAGVTKVVYEQSHYDKNHPDSIGLKLLKSAKVKVVKV